ncbi:MAG: hypothetical protein K6G33_05280 [Ruminococcus sp.]|uniref:hypothetical protein n=1 Tax=Ruminococcus sp. TaxID=41978 RepID=UPI0025D833D6|nr:hypothetical protein [Ruminococcus sp.]MCR5600136.1 hypothetical protein [Ruminococcus sp.]
MRALKIAALISAAAISLCSCGSEAAAKSGQEVTSAASEAVAPSSKEKTTIGSITPKEEAFETNSGYDVDLTELNSSMVYAQVYDMVNRPDDYKGKTVRAKGNFSYFKDAATGKEYFAVLISDATACCKQGIEFVLDGDYTYPDDYPALDTEITVSGNFNFYKDGDYTYCQLLNAKIEDQKLSW